MKRRSDENNFDVMSLKGVTFNDVFEDPEVSNIYELSAMSPKLELICSRFRFKRGAMAYVFDAREPVKQKQSIEWLICISKFSQKMQIERQSITKAHFAYVNSKF